jgi:hypothetical protein
LYFLLFGLAQSLKEFLLLAKHVITLNGLPSQARTKYVYALSFLLFNFGSVDAEQLSLVDVSTQSCFIPFLCLDCPYSKLHLFLTIEMHHSD